MPLTPETLPKHELTGLPVTVVDATNPDMIGITGQVVKETTNTLHVSRNTSSQEMTADTENDRVRQIPKHGAVFEFTLDDAVTDTDAAARQRGGGSRTPSHSEADDTVVVTVDGDRLRARPARRTETTGDSPWK